MSDWQRKQNEEANYHRQLGEKGIRTGHAASHQAYKNTYEPQQQKIAEANRRAANSGSGCFTLDTLVMVSSGWKPIGDLEKNDEVLSVSGDFSGIQKGKILKVARFGKKRIWRVVMAGDVECLINTTWAHAFSTTTGPKRTVSLSGGDEVYSIDRDGNLTTSRILRVERTEEYAPVANLVVSRNYNYVAQGAVVECFSFMRRLRKEMWRTVENRGPERGASGSLEGIASRA